MKKCVLIVDNDPDFLQTRVERLRSEGFTVFSAQSRDAARECFEQFRVHVAIIDIRLRRDSDEKDTTGLLLAKEEAYRTIPKIMMTNWPTYEAVREVMGPALEGLPSAVDFVAKKEGPEAMLAALQTAFEKYVRINADLTIETSARNPITFTHLASLVGEELENERLMVRGSELEDLFRSLFYRHKSIRIDRVLWQQHGRAAVTVFAFEEGRAPESFVVAYGEAAKVISEIQRYGDMTAITAGRYGTILNERSETLHYAASSFGLSGADLESAVTLVALYRMGAERIFNTALSGLVEETLGEWHQGNRTVDDSKPLDEIYRQRLDLTKKSLSIPERVRAIASQARSLVERLELASGRLTIQLGGQTFSYPDPSDALAIPWDNAQHIVLVNSPGTLTGDNILADLSGNTWLTDFSEAGPAPEMWNFVALEAAIRFDWIETNKLRSLHDFERCLVQTRFTRVDATDVEPLLRKPLRAIQTIRRLASREHQSDGYEYHLGILFQALRRLADFDPSKPLLPSELARLAHVLLAAAMTYELIGRATKTVATAAPLQQDGIQLDKASSSVWVDGSRVRLRGHSYDLLCVLFAQPGDTRSRRELVEQVFEEKYDENDPSQISKLNTAIRRLRERIEVDPDHPRHVLTEPGVGYRLIVRPRD